MAWGIPYPSKWNALPDEDRAWMLQTYVAREQMRAVEIDEQERDARKGGR
jgi:hypothetical protein